MTAMVMTACTGQQSDTASQNSDKEFNYVVDQFADLEILRYTVPGFESLSLQQKQLLYHLSEAALMGRDIFFDQNGRYNLAIRRTLEAIYTNYKGDREDPQFKALETYLKRVWFSSGIHHHYALDYAMVLEDGTSSPDRLGAGHEGRYQVLSAEVQEHLPPLDGEYQGLVYQPSALVGTPYPGLLLAGRWLRGSRDGRESFGTGEREMW